MIGIMHNCCYFVVFLYLSTTLQTPTSLAILASKKNNNVALPSKGLPIPAD